MIIKHIAIKNYGCHEELEVAFGPGINAVLGGNGTGKSTVLDAIQYGLIGQSSFEGNRADNVMWGAGTATVVVTFDHGGSDYQIKRLLGRNSTQVLKTPDGTELTRKSEIASFIEGICGTTVDALRNNIFVPQGKIDSILFSTDTVRLKEIQQTVGLDRAKDAVRLLGSEVQRYAVTVGLEQQIAMAKERLSEAVDSHKAVKEQLNEVEVDLDALKPAIDRYENAKRTQQMSVAIQQADTRIAALAERLEQIVGELDDAARKRDATKHMADTMAQMAADAKESLSTYEADKQAARSIAQLRGQLVETEKALEMLGAPPEGDAQALSEELDELRIKVSTREKQLSGALDRPKLPEEVALEEQLFEAKRALSALGNRRDTTHEESVRADTIQRESKNLEVFSSGTCPTCGQEVSDFDPVVREKEIAGLKAELKELTEQLDAEYQGRREALVQTVDQLQSDLSKFIEGATAALQASHEKLVAKSQALSHQLRELNRYHETADKLRNRHTLLEQQLDGREEVTWPQDEVDQLKKIVSDYERIVIALTEQNSTVKATAAACEHIESDLKEARESRKSLGDADDLPTEAELEALRSEVQKAAELNKTRSELDRKLSSARIEVEQYGSMIESLNEQQGKEARDQAWVKLCNRAREALHVSALPSLIMREYATILNRRIQYYLSVWEAPFNMRLDEDLAFIAEFDDGRILTAARLSGGQKIMASTSFRLAMADTFARQVGLLILDEPSNHLDRDNIVHLQQLLIKLKELAGASGRQIIMVDHEESLVGFFDHVITLNKQEEEL